MIITLSCFSQKLFPESSKTPIIWIKIKYCNKLRRFTCTTLNSHTVSVALWETLTLKTAVSVVKKPSGFLKGLYSFRETDVKICDSD